MKSDNCSFLISIVLYFPLRVSLPLSLRYPSSISLTDVGGDEPLIYFHKTLDIWSHSHIKKKKKEGKEAEEQCRVGRDKPEQDI